MSQRDWLCPSCANQLAADEVYDDLYIDCERCGAVHRFRYISGTYQLRIHLPPVEEVGEWVDEADNEVVEDGGTDIAPEWFRDTQSANDIRGGTPRVLWANAKDQRLQPVVTSRHLPIHRADCVNEIRPCPYVSCRHHLALVVDAHGVSETFPGTIDDWVFAGPLLEDGRFFADSDASRIVEGPHLEMLPATCVLDVVAEHGELTLRSAAYLLNVSRERIRQIEAKALRKLRNPLAHIEDE